MARDFKGSRLGWLGDYNGYLPMEDGIMSLCESALGDFATLGCNVERCLPDFSMARLWRSWLVHRHWLVHGNLAGAYANPKKRA
ncbi:amidase, partial [Paraburkholderia sp. SIMBA_027]